MSFIGALPLDYTQDGRRSNGLESVSLSCDCITSETMLIHCPQNTNLRYSQSCQVLRSLRTVEQARQGSTGTRLSVSNFQISSLFLSAQLASTNCLVERVSGILAPETRLRTLPRIPILISLKETFTNVDIAVDAESSVNRSYARTGHWDGLNRENYDLITKSKVTKIELDGNKATGVVFRPSEADGEDVEFTTVKANKEVVLSAGTIHSPQLLQLSGIGPRRLLESAGIETKVELPGVGQNFHDHTTLHFEIKCK